MCCPFLECMQMTMQAAVFLALCLLATKTAAQGNPRNIRSIFAIQPAWLLVIVFCNLSLPKPVPAVTTELFVSWEEMCQVKDAWRSAWTDSGAQFQMMAGDIETLRWFAANWDTPTLVIWYAIQLWFWRTTSTATSSYPRHRCSEVPECLLRAGHGRH